MRTIVDDFTRRFAAGSVSRWSAVLLAAAALAGLAACDAAKTAPSPAAGAALPVQVRVVQEQQLPITLEAVGQAEGSKQVEVRARVTGLIERQRYQEGEPVRAGAVLYQIERAPFEIALQQARAQLAQQQAQLDQARREYERLRPLAEAQAISRREADNAQSSLQLAQAAVALAQAQVRQAELNLSYTTVTAPISGISGRSLKSEGALVNPSTDSLLTTVTQTDPIWVRFALSEAELARVRAAGGTQVRLLSDRGESLLEQGRLNFAGSTVDPSLGTVPLRAEFANPRLRVLPGQFVKVQVVAGQARGFLVPQSAVMQNEQGRMVWVVREGQAQPAPIQTAGWLGSDWVVTSGLKASDQVIVEHLMKLRPGAPVAPQPAEPQPAAAPAAAAAASTQ
ncbi:efflux RND transporter periplasmic adaptor subunit [Caldimonas manganoxidans]|uniref:efflux RND transporter periplasmic adaptor subunit n=1 Tax=Caldimonas manganoxidans TaxID=196015 RepID=UPI0003659E5D|nr:efflux RND transporter periplasmic adaptor subunit [Caldimonas manganoxidans]